MTPNRRQPSAPATPEPGPDGHEGLPAEPAVHQEVGQWDAGESVPAQAAAEALQEAEDRFLRLAAEFDNYRKRTTREKAESLDRGGAAFASRLLDVLDDMDRLGASAATGPSDPFREGFAMIARKLAKELEGGGLVAIDPVGERFNPEEHEAVALAIPDDPALDDTVSATFQKGYRFRGMVIRHAKVQVYSVDGAL